MQKTRLGISVGLLGAALYFMGLLSLFGLIILAGYVLLSESDEWLRKSAVKAVAIVIVFSLISVIICFGSDILNFLNNLFHVTGESSIISYPLHLDVLITSLTNAAEKIVLFILGIKALLTK